jgi:CrcB protein
MIWLVGLGGAAGTLSRYYVGKWLNSKSASGFPWGTWAINLTGSLILGILFSLHLQGKASDTVWLMVGTGFCGGYTTFSTFGYETSQLIRNGQALKAGIYVMTTVVLGLLSAYAGMSLV